MNKNHGNADKGSRVKEDRKSSEPLVLQLYPVVKETELEDLAAGENNVVHGFDVEQQSNSRTATDKLRPDLESKTTLRYGVQEFPPMIITLMGALQHILLSLSGCLSTSSVVADVACVPFDHPIRSHLFCTTIFMVGLCTILQTALGIRLPIFQGPSSSFLVPLLALQRDPNWKCQSSADYYAESHNSGENATFSTNSSVDQVKNDPLPGIHWRLQEMSGALILASMIEIVMGLSGLLKVLLQFIGPITIACTISLIGVSLFKLPIVYGRANFPVAIGCMLLVMVFVLYLQGVAIPLPRFGKDSKTIPRRRFPIFQLLPILLGVIIMWVITWILTVCGVFTDDMNDIGYMARADAKANIITSSKWFQLTYPGQFGPPKISVALTIGFMVACFSSMIESVGDYYAAQKVCQTSSIPDHAISRGILIEGIGSILSATVGAGHATTSYSGNIAVLSLTKTASRMIMYAAGGILLAISLFGKAGAALTTIPNPILGGVMMIIISALLSIGLSNLKSVDMTISRNLLVLGVPFMAGIVVPACLDMYPDLIKTGQEEADRMINVIFGTPMFLGGSLALILDTTVPGTRESRGMVNLEHTPNNENDDEPDDVYSWTIYPRLIKICPFLSYLPFMPSGSRFRRLKKRKDINKNNIAMQESYE